MTMRFSHERRPLSDGEGWYSRGYLPHFDKAGQVQSLTIRLGDAMPKVLLDRWRLELANQPPGEGDLEYRKRIDAYLDAGHGECWLGQPRVATMVQDALLYFDEDRYRLLSWCVMPNHVHFVLEPWERWPLAGVLQSMKSFTSKEANKLLQRRGRFWQREYHDRYIRDDEHYAKVVRYIEENPVKAGLVKNAEDWPWSRAGGRKG
jgi:REP element-mobilizing transposase RayT